MKKINRRMDSEPEYKKHQSVIELRSVLKRIHTVVEDKESDDEISKFNDLKNNIKRDLMMSHISKK